MEKKSSLNLLLREIDLQLENAEKLRRNAEVVRENFRRIKQYLEDLGIERLREVDVLSDDHTQLNNIGLLTHPQLDAHVANLSNPHQVTADQIGATSVYDRVNSFDVTVNNQTTFTLTNVAKDPNVTSRMTINGLIQTYGEHYTISGNILTFYPLVAGFDLETSNEFGQPDRVIVSYMI